jgi:hypothetical protein
VNRLSGNLSVLLRQVGSDVASQSTLAAGEQRPWHWAMSPDKSSPLRRRLTVTLQKNSDGPKHAWSGPFLIDEVGEHSLRLRGATPDVPEYYLRMEVQDAYYTTFVIFTDMSQEAVPFRIENDTDFEFEAVQKGQTLKTMVGPATSVNFGWDDPCGAQELVMSSPLFNEDGKHKPRVYKLAKIQSLKAIKIKGQKPVYNYLRADGPTRVLVFTQKRSKYETQTGAKAAKTRGPTDKAKQLKREQQSGQHAQGEIALRATVVLAGVGVSLITKEPRELMFFSLGGILASFTQSATDVEIEAKVQSIQLDNQLTNVEFPIILRGSPKDEQHPWLHVAIVKSSLYSAMNFFTYFSFLAQEITLNVESDLIGHILAFYQSLPISTFTAAALPADPAVAQQEKAARGEWEADGERAVSMGGNAAATQRMVYFKLLHLNPIKVSLTFSTKPGAVLGLPRNPLTAIIETIANAVGNLDRAPLCFNALLLQHPFCSQQALVSRITTHYTRQGITEVGKLIGSMDVLGNPVGLFSNLGTGVLDFFHEPAAGFVQSPAAFGKGLARGTSSLVKNSVYGMFNSVSKIVGAVGKGVATLSFDDDYVRQRQINQRKQPKHVVQGALQGAQALGMGVFHGITGVVLKPVEGARKGGALGLAKGLG